MKSFWCFLGLFFSLFLVFLIFFDGKKERDVGLLTDDYGIVTQKDLDREKAIAFPVPFSPKVLIWE